MKCLSTDIKVCYSSRLHTWCILPSMQAFLNTSKRWGFAYLTATQIEAIIQPSFYMHIAYWYVNQWDEWNWIQFIILKFNQCISQYFVFEHWTQLSDIKGGYEYMHVYIRPWAWTSPNWNDETRPGARMRTWRQRGRFFWPELKGQKYTSLE